MNNAFLFPGQGSQYVGMGKDISIHWPIVRQIFIEANDVLGYDLKKLCFEGPLARLTSTEEAQPAIFTTSVATLHVLAEEGIKADIAVGHSVGVFAALVAAGGLTFSAALRLVRLRGQLMAAVQQHGTMLAVVAAKENLLTEILADAGQLEVAAYNSPTQVVFSGSEEAILDQEARLHDHIGIHTKHLLVSHAFHSRLMAEKQDAWRQCLQESTIVQTQIPVGLNVTGELSTDATSIREDLQMQFTRPVQWCQIFNSLLAFKNISLIEVGAGHTLAGLAHSWHEKPHIHNTDTASAIVHMLRSMPVSIGV